jgi:hypothetical protein
MKKKKKSSREPEQEKINIAEKQRQDKARAARHANAEKQKRYRQSMKAQGYKAKLIWEKPLETGWVRTEVPVIHESSVNIAIKNQDMREILEYMTWSFISNCEKKGIQRKIWRPVYEDIMNLIKPFGIE